jgi:cytidine deaminase
LSDSKKDPGGENESELLSAGRAARRYAIAPYSTFAVGAALRTAGGRIFTGANIENASYGLTVCAERVALWKALSEGERAFTTLVVASPHDTMTPPCGACRQLLWEFCGDILVILAGPASVAARYRLSDLLPHPFDGRTLG